MNYDSGISCLTTHDTTGACGPSRRRLGDHSTRFTAQFYNLNYQFNQFKHSNRCKTLPTSYSCSPGSSPR